MSNKLTVTASPHRRDNVSTQKIMLMVIIALLPSVVASAIYFGFRAILLIAICVATCVLTEFVCRKLMKRNQTISDLSACVTGILLALNLPVTLPIWEAVIGSFVAIAVVKQLFGGIGQNFANPAIVGRIVLMLSFTADMTTWAIPKYYQNSGEVITGATPLVSGDASYLDLFLGNVGGCLGETSALAILIGGLFLIVMKVISPSAPISFIGTVAILTAITGGDVGYQVLAGGLLLGAFFMATDYSTTPITEKGRIIFGIGCGIITFVIRNYGGYPEGVSFSILLMNVLTPYIDRLTMSKPVGAKYPEKNKEEVSK
ncbi:MAG: RnfABCDGE type electron transport complex subunit D [Ruminococcus sp.]|nr:RnfABCDGE type electron transport complex subunit D [Ruminococcus sp.]